MSEKSDDRSVHRPVFSSSSSPHDNEEANTSLLISKVLALGGSSRLPNGTVLAASKDHQSTTKKELMALSYVCVETKSPDEAAYRLGSYGYMMIVLDIAEEETVSSLFLEGNDASMVESKELPAGESQTNSPRDDFYLSILDVATKKAPMLPMLILNRSQVPNALLQGHYTKLFPTISYLQVIAAPLSDFQNVDKLESMAAVGRQAINSALSDSWRQSKTSTPSHIIKGEASLDVSESTNPGRISKASVSEARNKSTNSGTSTTMRSSRPVGTSSFIAPELIEGRSYGPSVDWWACGVTIYECTTREKLFGNGSRTNAEIFKSILEQKIDLSALTRVCVEQADEEDQSKHLIKYCYGMINDTLSNVEDLVAGLLQRDQRKRLGSESPNDIKSHRFYGSVNWTTLNITEPSFKPEPLPIYDHPHSAKKLVTVTRHGKRVRVRAEELFYGKPYKFEDRGNHNFEFNDSESLPTRGSKARSRPMRQTNRRMSAERVRFSNISDLRQTWLRRWPNMSSTEHFSGNHSSAGNRQSRASASYYRMPLIEEIEEPMRPSFNESDTSENQTVDSTTDVSISKTSASQPDSA